MAVSAPCTLVAPNASTLLARTVSRPLTTSHFAAAQAVAVPATSCLLAAFASPTGSATLPTHPPFWFLVLDQTGMSRVFIMPRNRNTDNVCANRRSSIWEAHKRPEGG